jgi:hypothetical protein
VEGVPLTVLAKGVGRHPVWVVSGVAVVLCIALFVLPVGAHERADVYDSRILRIAPVSAETVQVTIKITNVGWTSGSAKCVIMVRSEDGTYTGYAKATIPVHKSISVTQGVRVAGKGAVRFRRTTHRELLSPLTRPLRLSKPHTNPASHSHTWLGNRRRVGVYLPRVVPR